MIFAHPQWLFLLIAVPLVVGISALCWRRRLNATAAWASRGLWHRLLAGYEPWRLLVSCAALGVAFGGLVLALAQPRWGQGEQQVERQGVDVVVVLDTSLSMATNDVQPNRLWVAQTLVRQLVEALPGNRVALVQAEGDGVVMVPLTADVAVIDLLLDAVLPGSLPTPGTELAAAVRRAAELFPEAEEKHRVIVLLSDGEDHGKELTKTAETLREQGTVLHAIGVGTLQGKPLEVPRLEGGDGLEYKRDQEGNIVVSRLVETSLESLSRETGGLYLRADGAATRLTPIVERIQGMEKRSFGSEVVNTLEERFQWPLTLAALALLLQLALPPFASGETW